ncbi:MAG: glycosyltransferase N-terminal domain-containing protein [Dysgonamonadaceae bacterium]
MYDFIISVYATLVCLAKTFNPKARLMLEGHKDIFRILNEKIDPNEQYVWIHAASLGEFEQGRPIIERLKRDYPKYKILLTFFSPSGYEVRKDYPLADVVCYLPFDKQKNVLKFLKIVNPQIAVFIKYEFWYNYLTELHHQNIPTYIVSAIFRPSQLFFKWYGARSRRVLPFYSSICVQDENSMNLLKQFDLTNVKVCGDTRFDRVVDICHQASDIRLVDEFVNAGARDEQVTLIAGSSWAKDEDIFIPYFNRNKNLKLIIAPHEIHESHLTEIEGKLQRPAIRLSQADGKDLSMYDCLIVDCFGLLSSIYRYGQIAYIGGGFGVGIHNVLEAAVYGIPVIFGSNYQKFREAVELIKAKGGFSIQDEHQFNQLVDSLLNNRDLLLSSGKNASEFVNRNTKAVDKVMTELSKNL